MSLVFLTSPIPRNINNFKRDTMKANMMGGGKFYLQINAQFALVIDLVEKTWNNNSCWMYLFQCTCLSNAAANVTSAIGLHLLTVFTGGSKKKGAPIHWHQWHFSAPWQVLTCMVAAALKIGWFTPVFFLRENNPVTLDRAQLAAGVAACPSCRRGWWTRRTAWGSDP